MRRCPNLNRGPRERPRSGHSWGSDGTAERREECCPRDSIPNAAQPVSERVTAPMQGPPVNRARSSGACRSQLVRASADPARICGACERLRPTVAAPTAARPARTGPAQASPAEKAYRAVDRTSFPAFSCRTDARSRSSARCPSGSNRPAVWPCRRASRRTPCPADGRQGSRQT